MVGHSETTCRSPFNSSGWPHGRSVSSCKLTDYPTFFQLTTHMALVKASACATKGRVLCPLKLMPLLAGQTMLITVAKVDDKTLRVNVIPMERPKTTRLTVHRSPIPARPRNSMRRSGKHLAGYGQTHQHPCRSQSQTGGCCQGSSRGSQAQSRRPQKGRLEPTRYPHCTAKRKDMRGGSKPAPCFERHEC